MNLVLLGGVPVWVRPFFFGATLLAFSKKAGDVRPIAVGGCLRRLVGKVACRVVSERCLDLLKPRQLGVGVKGGAEALAHGARRYLDNLPVGHVFVKLDFANAFNSVRRDAVREATLLHAPELLGYVDSAYGAESYLSYGDFTIRSAEGIQQGDPLGPLLFCLAIHPLLQDIKSEFVTGYLDDIGIGGSLQSVTKDVRQLEHRARSLGLALNHTKCEVIGLHPADRIRWCSAGLHFQERSLTEATLLGSPLQAGTGVDVTLASKIEELGLMAERLAVLPAHAALHLLRHAFAIPKLLYVLRTAPCCDSPELLRYDCTLRASLSSLLNVEMSDSSWSQSCLPIRWGGIGIRSAHRLAPSAFLASAASASELLTLLLPSQVLSVPDPAVIRAQTVWTSQGGACIPVGSAASVQRNWDEEVSRVAALRLREGVDETSLARLQASCAPHSGIWLNAIPSAALGLNLDNNMIRVAVGLRLGVPLVLAHRCTCGTQVDPLGHHGLACQHSAGRHSRHNMLNDIILRALQSAGIPSIREPPGLSRSDAKRPDGVTLVPWSRGRCLVWDATCPDTLAPSHVHQSSVSAGSSAAASESVKLGKYAALAVDHEIVPIAIETLGTWGCLGLAFVNELGKRIASVSGDQRATVFLKQRLSLAVQRGNAAAILGTLAQDNSQHDDDFN